MAVRTLVVPFVTLTPGATTVTAGQSVNLTAAVRPEHPGMAVTYQWLDATGAWKDVGSGTLNSASQHTTSFSIPAVATFWFRVVLPAHRDHAEAHGIADVVGAAPASPPPPPTSPPPPPTNPPPPAGPAVYEANDTAPGGRPPAVAPRVATSSLPVPRTARTAGAAGSR